MARTYESGFSEQDAGSSALEYGLNAGASTDTV